MKTLKLFSLLLLTGSIGISCQSEKPSEKKEIDTIESVFLSVDDALFRGSNIGDSASQIRANEKDKAVQNSDSLIHYHNSYTFETGVTEVDVFYTFDEFGLFEIQVDFYPENAETPVDLMNRIEDNLTARFGDPKELGLVKRWTTFSQSNNVIEITLSDESADAGEPFVSLNFLEPLPDEI